jgi:3-oxoadipate enol-lactonase
MATYERDGLRLHYDVVGEGPPVLCVHGASGTAAFEWADLASGLADRHRLIMPDLRGHGRSDHRGGETSIERVDDDLLALIDLECQRRPERPGSGEPRSGEPERPHLLAFSFGAEAALALELTRPGTSASLVLLSPGLGDPKSSVPTPAQLEAGWPRSLRRLHTEHHGEGHWLELMIELCERAARRPKADLAAVAAIACPVLLVVGLDDDPRRLRQARVMAGAHPRCRLVEIAHARHAVHKDRPVEVLEAVNRFLDDVALDDVSGTGHRVR